MSDDDLQDRLTRTEFDGDSEAAEKLRKSAQRTIEQQVASLDDIDTKAIKILRVNVLLTGLILTALSFAANSTFVTVGDLLNPYVGVGLLSLILSSATAAWTYTVSDVAVGVSPTDIAAVLELDLSDDEFEEVLLKSYAAWIAFNDETNLRNTPLITMTVLLVVVAIAYLSLGMFAGLVGPVHWLLVAAVDLLLLAVVYVTGLVQQIRRAIRDGV